MLIIVFDLFLVCCALASFMVWTYFYATTSHEEIEFQKILTAEYYMTMFQGTQTDVVAYYTVWAVPVLSGIYTYFSGQIFKTLA